MTFPVVGSNQPLPFEISNSLRFNDDDNAYLSKTLSASPTNQKIVSCSFWVKRANLGVYSYNLVGNTSAPYVIIGFINDDTFSFQLNAGSGSTGLITTAKFRDTSAWYHTLCVLDTTQGTASNRMKMYINGVQITNFGTANYPAQDSTWNINTNVEHSVGGSSTIQDFDGYMAECHFIDGQALSPTDFGEYDEDSGVWKPKQYAGTYGTNGFYLKFNNTGNMGEDSSGNDNTFTPTNLSGTTDVTSDTPTNNFATFNPLRHNITTGGSESEGNLKYVNSGNVQEDRIFGNIGLSSGKWYWEGLCTGTSPNCQIGLNSTSQLPTNDTYRVTYKSSDGATVGLGGSTYSTYTNGDIIGVAFDADNSQITLYKNNTAQTGSPVSITVDSQGMQPFFVTFSGEGASNSGWVANFGQEGSFAGNKTAQNNSDGNGYGNFYYSPPSGYLALCTQNLATALSPTIDDGSAYFQTKTYTGNGVETAITNDGNSNLQPDLIWFKARSAAYYHGLFDSTRGTELRLSSNVTDAEVTKSSAFTSFDSDGFTVGADVSNTTNASGQTFVAWQWKANGGTTSSNTDGSITSTVQANTTAGFSIVTYTGNATAGATVGHGLSKKPDMIIAKNRNTTSPPRDWLILHKAYEGTSAENMRFTAMAVASAGSQASSGWYRTAPTSSVFYLGNGSAGDYSGDTNLSGGSMIAYCFAEIEGYSKFGSYTGNGSTDGTFVYTGFRPAFVMTKVVSNADDWSIHDNKRLIINGSNYYLNPNLSNAEVTTYQTFNILSNGFKLTNTDGKFNGNGASYIYMAFAENPFVTSGATPVTAR